MTDQQEGYVSLQYSVDLLEGEHVVVEKVASLVTSKTLAMYEPGIHAVERLFRAGSFDELLERHELSWGLLWRRFDITIEGSERIQMILRLHIFHLLQTVSTNTIDLDVGIPARGLHGEAYRGHIFWDELFIFQLLNFRLPALTRTLLDYRYRRLPEAKWAAARAGHEGAMYPVAIWKRRPRATRPSTSTPLGTMVAGSLSPATAHRPRGRPRRVPVPRGHGRSRVPPVPRRADADRDRPLLGERDHYDRALARYRISGVMGPDEYHDGYPDRDEPGLDDNAYTNVMVVSLLSRVLELLERLPEHHRQALWETLHLSREGSTGGRTSAVRCSFRSTTGSSASSPGTRTSWSSTGSSTSNDTETSTAWTGSSRARATHPTGTRPPSRPMR